MRSLIVAIITSAIVHAQNGNIPPQLDTTIIDAQSIVKADVHQPGTWTLDVGPTGAAGAFQVTATVTPTNGGNLTFDLSAGLAALPDKKLPTGWPITLRPPMGGDPTMTATVTVVPKAAVTDIAPSFVGTIVPSSKSVKAIVHNFGTWTLTIKPTMGDEFSVIAAASTDNKGQITFDLKDVLSKLTPATLEIGWTVTLRPPTTLTTAQQAALIISTTVRTSEVTIRVNPVHEGDDVITGTVTGTVDMVRGEVLSPAGIALNITEEDTPRNEKFSLGLPSRVPEGHTVRVVAYLEGEEVGSFSYTSVIPVTYGWGRVRAYFTAGATVAAQDEAPKTQTDANGVTTTTQERKFSSANYFVSLNVDKNWHTSLRNRGALSCERPSGLIEDLLQLEEIAIDWNRSKYRKMLPDTGQSAKLAAKALSGISNAVTTTANHIGQAYGSDCTNAEKLRADLLEGLQPTLTTHIAILNELASTFEARHDEFNRNIRSIDAVDDTRLLPFIRQNQGITWYADELRKLKTTLEAEERQAAANKSKTATAKDATDDNRVRAELLKKTNALLRGAENLLTTITEIELRIQEADDDIRSLETAIREFHRSDPGAPRGAWMLNSSFEGRLAQAPIVGQTGSVSAGAATIVQNPNTGYVAADVYVPMWTRATSWKNENSEQALFWAPIFKAGLLMANSGPVPVPSTPDSQQLFRQVMPFWSAGLRLGHFTLSPKPEQVAPELISFLDITYGRFDNFRQPRNSIAAVLPTPRDFIAKRVEVTGRFRVPETPLYLGFTANFGPGQDDMRYFFGTRFDFSKAIGKLLSRQP